MNLLGFLITIIIVGVLLWVINSYVPMDARVKQILNIVVILILIIWILKALGVFAWMSGVTL